MSAKSTFRTFVAVEIDESVRANAAELIESLRAVAGSVKWVEPHNLHLTLKFLGDVADRDIHGVCQAVGRAVEEIEPFELELRGVGAFPHPGRPRTVWIGCDAGSQQLCTVQERVEKSLAKLGFRPEGRRFEPHLTIGRVRSGGPPSSGLPERLRENADCILGRSAVEELVVFSSHLAPTGPTYEALGRFPLGGKAAGRK